MDTLSALIGSLVSVGFVTLTIYVANQDDAASARGTRVRWLLYLTLAANAMLGLGGLTALPSPGDPAAEDTLSTSLTASGLPGLAVTAVSSGAGLMVVLSANMRRRIRQVVGSAGTYDPDSQVHTTAIVLALVLVSMTLVSFFQLGGIEGLAQQIASDGIPIGDVLVQQVLWIGSAVLGVGWLVRRRGRAIIARLGLRLPTRDDWVAGIVAALIGYGLIIVASTIWALLVSPEVLQEQTAASSQFSAAFTSLPQAFIVALAVAFGEEIFFRGAFQPVFGNLITSLFFAVVHAQYTLTPATVVILVVSIGFGYLRERYSTTSAIIAHFLYNFLQLALALLATDLLSGAS